MVTPQNLEMNSKGERRKKMAYQDVKDRLYRGQGHRKVANNTRLELVSRELGERIEMTLHGHIVARFYPRYMQLFSGSWHTATTKDRLNMALSIGGVKVSGIYQKDWVWYYGNYCKGDREFYDGMALDYSGHLVDPIGTSL